LTTVDYGNGHVVTYVYDPASNTVREQASSPDNTLLVSVSPAASGSVSGNGIACPGDCSEAFSGTPSVTLTAAPAAGWTVLGWTGDAAGTGSAVTLAMTTDRTAGCYFGAADGQTDSDGLDDATEMGPNGNDPSYDGNHDGIPDYQQDNAASLPANGGGGNAPQGSSYATLAVPAPLTLSNVAAVPNPSPSDAPPGASFPFGFFEFTIEGLDPGACTTLDLFLPPSELTHYYKYGPRPDDPTPQWYDFVHYHPALPGAEIWPRDGYVQIRLFLCDAQLGDDVVATEDGKIVDAGGPSGTLAAAITVAPTSLAFDTIPAGTSTELTVDVSSTGQDDLVIGNVGGAEGLEVPFTFGSDECSGRTLPPGGSCRIVVRFAPQLAGEFSDRFDIPSNDGVSPSVRVDVSGSATEARPIPALGRTGMMILAILLIALAADLIRRRGV
ncbi:MAG TPA: hypothetical protein ENK19_10745, partial [Acidobacteria bacterium]|nr:hypothetical protein [Acidobacteriota bacterium]